VAGAVKSAVGDRSDQGADLVDDPADEIDPDVLKQVKRQAASFEHPQFDAPPGRRSVFGGHCAVVVALRSRGCKQPTGCKAAETVHLTLAGGRRRQVQDDAREAAEQEIDDAVATAQVRAARTAAGSGSGARGRSPLARRGRGRRLGCDSARAAAGASTGGAAAGGMAGGVIGGGGGSHKTVTMRAARRRTPRRSRTTPPAAGAAGPPARHRARPPEFHAERE
jgi:hypothetical protein